MGDTTFQQVDLFREGKIVTNFDENLSAIYDENVKDIEHARPSVARANSLEGINSSSFNSSSSSSSSDPATTEIARNAKKMSSASLARKLSDTSAQLVDGELTQPSIVKEQFR